MFSSKDDSPADGNGFRATVSTTVNPVPVPVEVAHDMAQIREGRFPAEASEGWQETPPSEDDEAAAEPEETTSETDEQKVNTENSHETSAESPKPQVSKVGKNQKYVVKNGDTLMKIAFQEYGNVYRWREIYNDNKAVIADYNALVSGTVLVIHGVEYVVIRKNGKPYLIRWKDTLGRISRRVYGTPEYWRQLWRNNPQLIHNPNKIYAGFTLYYAPLSAKDRRISTLPKKIWNRLPSSALNSIKK